MSSSSFAFSLKWGLSVLKGICYSISLQSRPDGSDVTQVQWDHDTI